MSKLYKFNQFYIPERMMSGIRRYVEHGVRPGDFLSAVIQNNLSQAVGRADTENLKNIPAFVAYFYNECPGTCWGSPEKMEAWIDSFREKKQRVSKTGLTENMLRIYEGLKEEGEG